MGTNFYLRLKRPRMVPHYDAIHIAKRSCGWKPLFQAVDGDPYHYDWTGPKVEPPEDDDETVYSIHSVADIRSYLSTGDFEIVDEYGRPLADVEFESEVVAWNADNDDAHSHQGVSGACSFVHPEGFEFMRRAFS